MDHPLTEENFSETFENVERDLSSDKTTLLEILEDLRSYLTSTHVGKRKMGLEFLTRILITTKKPLNSNEIRIFVEFYSDRCKDHHSLYPIIIRGFEFLWFQSNLESPILLITSLRIFFNEIQTQSQMLSDRRIIFDILARLIRDKTNELTSLMGTEFIIGFIEAVNGEKDPECLLVILTCWPYLIRDFPSFPLIEDIFELLSSYFPIDFMGSNESYQITKERLVLLLRQCLSTTPEFSNLVIPFLLEKIDSDWNDAKLDGIQTLTKCIQIYDPHHLKKHLNEIWKVFKVLLFKIEKNSNLEIRESSLETIRILNTRLLPDSELTSYFVIDIVWNDLKGHLYDSNLIFMNLSIDVIQGLVISGSADILLPVVVPELMKTFLRTKNYRILSMIGSLVNVVDYELNGNMDEFISVIMTSLSDNESIRNEALSALSLGGYRLLTSDTKRILLRHIENWIRLDIDFIKNPILFENLADSVDDVTPWIRFLNEDVNRNNNNTLYIMERFCVYEPIRIKLSSSLYEYLDNEDVLKMLIRLEDRYPLYNITELNNRLHHRRSKTDYESRYELISKIMTRHCPEKRVQNIRDLPLKIVEAHWKSSNPEYIVESQIWKSVFSSDADTMILSQNDDDERLALIRLRFNFLNKIPSNPEIVTSLLSVSKNHSIHFRWMLRALLLKGDRQHIKQWIDVLFRDYTSDLTEIFRFLITDPSTDIPGHTNLTISSVYRQKLFCLTRSKLLSGLEKPKHEWRRICLESLMIQLPLLSPSILEAELPGLKSTLLEALTDSTSIVSSTLTSIKVVLVNDVSLWDIETFLPRWIQIGIDGDRMDNRILALECIELCTKSLDKPRLVRLQSEIVRKLEPALNDRKRLVRKAAVSARNAWSLI